MMVGKEEILIDPWLDGISIDQKSQSRALSSLSAEFWRTDPESIQTDRGKVRGLFVPDGVEYPRHRLDCGFHARQRSNRGITKDDPVCREAREALPPLASKFRAV